MDGELPLPVTITRQNSGAGCSLDFEPKLEYVFVDNLQERYKCARCHQVLHNPHQTGCGHRFCEKCISVLRELQEMPQCPIDKEIIKPQEVFKDNCCKREVLNLQVYCKNAPDCEVKVTLGRYQDHLGKCLSEKIACTNEGCHDKMLQKDLKDHLDTHCKLREEKCKYCSQNMASINLKGHIRVYCPLYPVSCSNNCSFVCPREELAEHLALCPEAEIECPFVNYGCHFKVKQGNIKEHEDQFLREHMLCVLNKNTKLEGQMLELQECLKQKENKIQQLSDKVMWCEKECRQFMQNMGANGNHLASAQTLASYIEKAAWLETQVVQLVHLVSQEQSRLDLRPLVETIECTKQKIANMETCKDRLDNLEFRFSEQDLQLNLHKSQLRSNEERFKLLEGTCYNGILIWKIPDYEKKKREAIEGRIFSIYSQQFYTSRCGYRLCGRAYLNGDGSGKGAYLSLYFALMKGEFDSLLSWPFKQKVTLMILDQSGKKNNITYVFKSDPNSSSFKRPENDMNIGTGCPRFVSHSQLENPKNGCYIKDDTLFVKIAVDLTGLEEL
ncbi:TNF receptor-associated factor 5 isoform X2 [Bombina bombina]|nr:TNF receptor-associated factor 5 isoform X2 [Bombina bombina]XP_053568375.1 TNF receptor-associated factor 5 isoform X2 [Bombina bombina]